MYQEFCYNGVCYNKITLYTHYYVHSISSKASRCTYMQFTLPLVLVLVYSMIITVTVNIMSLIEWQQIMLPVRRKFKARAFVSHINIMVSYHYIVQLLLLHPMGVPSIPLTKVRETIGISQPRQLLFLKINNIWQACSTCIMLYNYNYNYKHIICVLARQCFESHSNSNH